MQPELVISSHYGGFGGGDFDDDRLKLKIGSPPVLSSARQCLTATNFAGSDLFYHYSTMSPKDGGSPATMLTQPQSLPNSGGGSFSLTPSSVSFDDELVAEDAAAAIEERLYLARLTLHFQEIAERYDLCLTHLQDATEEAEALRLENASLRIANAELVKRLALLEATAKLGAIQEGGGIPSTYAALTEELRRLGVVSDSMPDEKSPTSVLAYNREGAGARSNHAFGRQQGPVAASSAQNKVALPKSISIRSSGYLKLNSPVTSGSPASCNTHRLRVLSPPSPAMIGAQQQQLAEEEEESAGGWAKNKGIGGEAEGGGRGDLGVGKEKAADTGGALEVEVYSQGMFKTELCNKWEEKGECPYGEHCQFAHGITELRPVIRHPRYKTEVCRMVLAGEPCPYGHRCHFRHTLSPSDLPMLPRP